MGDTVTRLPEPAAFALPLGPKIHCPEPMAASPCGSRSDDSLTGRRKKKPYKELTLEEKVQLIRMAEENAGMSQAAIAERYSIAKSNVCRILQRKREYIKALESAGYAGSRKRKLKSVDAHHLVEQKENESSDSLRTHMYSKHGISRMFICRCCNWAFPDKRALHFHIQVKEESEARIEAASLLGSTSIMANLPSSNSTKQEIPGLAATERIHRELMQQHQLFQQHLVHQHQNVIPQPTPIHGIPSIPPAPTMPSAFSIDPKSAFSPLIRRPATSNNNSPNFATLDQPAMPLPVPSATQTPITTATATSQHSFPQPCSQAEAFQQALLQHMMNTKLQGIPFPTNPLITAGLYQMATAQLPPEQRGQISFPTVLQAVQMEQEMSSAVSATESEASLHTPKSSHARTTSDDTEPPRLKMQTLRNPMYPDVAPHISPSDSHTSGSGSPTGPNCQTPRECFECQQARAQIATLQKRYEELEQNKGRVHAELLRLRQDTQNLPAVFGAVDAENRRMKEILREIKQRIDDFQSSPKSGDEGHLFATALRGCIY